MMWSSIYSSFLLMSFFLFLFAGLMLFFERKLIGMAQKRLGISFLGRNGWVHLPADVLKFWFKFSNKNQTTWLGKQAGLAGLILIFVAWNLLACMFFLTDGFSSLMDFWDYQLLAYMAYANLTTLFTYSIILALRSKYSLMAAGRFLLLPIFLELFFTLVYLFLFFYSGGYGLEELSEVNRYGSLMAALPPLALLFFLYALFEAKRAPFDHSEAESELVAGHLVELGGRTLLFFYFCEYIHIHFCLFFMLIVCCGSGSLATLLNILPASGHLWYL